MMVMRPGLPEQPGAQPDPTPGARDLAMIHTAAFAVDR